MTWLKLSGKDYQGAKKAKELFDSIRRLIVRLSGKPPRRRGSPATVAKIHVRMSELKRELDQAKKEAGECRVTKSG